MILHTKRWTTLEHSVIEVSLTNGSSDVLKTSNSYHAAPPFSTAESAHSKHQNFTGYRHAAASAHSDDEPACGEAVVGTHSGGP